ncbi:hypothetical protein [Streptomyces sp. NPDC008001]
MSGTVCGYQGTEEVLDDLMRQKGEDVHAQRLTEQRPAGGAA